MINYKMTIAPRNALVLILAGFMILTNHICFARDLTHDPPSDTEQYLDCTLGATGSRGWIPANNYQTKGSTQIFVTEVTKGSPADGKLAAGDVILGVNGKQFSSDARVEFAIALTEAERPSRKGTLTLTRWRSGERSEVVLTMKPVGTYSDTAPYNCRKSTAIFEQGCEQLADRIRSGRHYKEVQRFYQHMDFFPLLASNNPEYHDLLAEHARKIALTPFGQAKGMYRCWYRSYLTIFLSEYILKMEDRTYLPQLTEFAIEMAKGQSIHGNWSHGYANEEGILHNYGAVNNVTAAMALGLALARKAGVKSPLVDQAIERSRNYLHYYVNRGAIPYGNQDGYIDRHEDNGSSAAAAIFFDLLGDSEAATFFARNNAASYGRERFIGHTGNYFSIFWALPGIQLLGPETSGAWMREFGIWYHDLARPFSGRWRFPPVPGHSTSYNRKSCTGALLMAYATPLKSLYITGKGTSHVMPLSKAEALRLIEDGRPRSTGELKHYYDSLSDKQVLEKLGSWSPTIRQDAARLISRRFTEISIDLEQLLEHDDKNVRYGALKAVRQCYFKEALPKLASILRESSDYKERILAGEAITRILQGPRGKKYKNELNLLAHHALRPPSPDDSRGIEKRIFVSLVVNSAIRKSLIERGLFIQVLREMITHEDAYLRHQTVNQLRGDFDDLRPYFSAVIDGIKFPERFSQKSPISSKRYLDILATHKIAEGLPIALGLLKEGNPYAIEAVEKYGPAAQSIIHELEELALENLPGKSQVKAQQIDELIKKVKTLPGSFRLIDTSPFNLFPQDEAVDVGLKAKLSLNLPNNSAQLQLGSGKIIITDSDENLFESITLPTDQVKISGNKAVISLSRDFQPNTRYSVIIDTGVFILQSEQPVQGVSERVHLGIPSNVDWNFTIRSQ